METFQPVVVNSGMNAQAIISVSATVVILTQMLKWSGSVPDSRGWLAVVLLAFVGVGIWALSQPTITRAELWDYFAGWAAVASSAAGVFGFTRAASSAVTALRPPPGGGAGTNPTVQA